MIYMYIYIYSKKGVSLVLFQNLKCILYKASNYSRPVEVY